ncbi:hypothetical protein TNCV_1452231 [Trichonephila clavipes]|nr:hypothetical protein TNCV_1452231 [Trichonephila clavipes]
MTSCTGGVMVRPLARSTLVRSEQGLTAPLMLFSKCVGVGRLLAIGQRSHSSDFGRALVTTHLVKCAQL